jgi:hypothetical protein
MIVNFKQGRNWLARFTARSGSHPPCRGTYLEANRPSLSQMAAPSFPLPAFVQQCVLAQRYLTLLGQLDWDNFSVRNPDRVYPGSQPAARAPFVAAFLIKIDQKLRYMADLRRFLVAHPALVWLCGFPLHHSAEHPYGFDPAASLPTTRQFLHVLRTLPNATLQGLLDNTVSLIQAELPAEIDFGQHICGDTKHILAWVKENNPKTYLKRSDRYDKNRQPTADKDCKLGCKKRSNQTKTPTAEGVPARTVSVGEYYWGYASGIIATKVPDWGEFVLAELTQTFDKGDTTFFFPLMAATAARLGRKPKFGAFDAAFDAWYVYDYFNEAGGFAAIPYVKRTPVKRQFDTQGLPLCEANLAMPLLSTFMNKRGLIPQRMGRYGCPLLFPEATTQTCPINHKKWPTGGCHLTMGVSPGARLRYQLDRHSPAYKLVYNQRTAAERINALAVELGIERPKLRNQQAIANLNTLIYILLNLRAWQRMRQHNLQ